MDSLYGETWCNLQSVSNDMSVDKFRLVANVRGGSTSFPLSAVRYESLEDARIGAKQLIHEQQRVMRVMVVQDELPPRFVEWIERS